MSNINKTELFKRIYGYIAAGSIGNSMGELMEGYTVEERQKFYGYIDYLPEVKKPGREFPATNRKATNPFDVGFGHPPIRHTYTRAPGTTEDGEERFRLLSTAIIEKGGRIDINDLAAVWVRDVKPEMFGWQVGSQDQVIYYSLKSGVPPWEVGRYASWPGLIGTTKMMGAIGVVNAGYPELAAQDGRELARIKDVRGVPGNYAVEIAGAHCAGVATSLMPNATIDMVVEAAAKQLGPTPLKEFLDVQEIALTCNGDHELFGKKLQDKYDNRQVSNAMEIISAGYALMRMADADPRKAIVYAVNSGRDTDCRAHIAGSLAGALKGIDVVPAEWVKMVDEAMKVNEYTTSNRTSLETAEGLYKALMNNLATMQKTLDDMNQINR